MMIGHNGGPSFDDVVKETLDRGILLAKVETLMAMGRDFRLEHRHRVVLVEIVDTLNNQTGTAFPGRKLLSELASRWSLKPYTENGVAKTISELIAYGYIIQDRRAPSGGGRALSHYALKQISNELLEQAITIAIDTIRRERVERADVVSFADFKRNSNVTPVGNVTSVGNITPIGNVTSVGNDRDANVTPVGNVRPNSNVTPVGNVTSVGEADVTPVAPTVTSKITTPITTDSHTSANEPAERKERKSRERATRLPEDWVLPRSWGMWAYERFLVSEDQVRQEAARFKNHWLAEAGPKARKLNWYRAWQNWCSSDYRAWRVRPNAPADDATGPDLVRLAQAVSIEQDDPWADVRRQQRAMSDD